MLEVTLVLITFYAGMEPPYQVKTFPMRDQNTCWTVAQMYMNQNEQKLKQINATCEVQRVPKPR
jgi:hypothetical protein